jgi:Tol biopolymer transport system component
MKNCSISQSEITHASAHSTSSLRPSRRDWLSNVASLVAVASVGACGGGGGDSNEGGGGGGGSEGDPSGLIIAQSTAELQVFNAATRALTVYPSSSSRLRVGVGASRAGVVGLVVNEDARVSWDILLLNAKTGTEVRRITISRPFATATSAVSVNADATRIAFSVNEPASESDNTRVDRTLVADLATLNATRLEGVTEPVFMGSELLVRNGERLRVLNANLDDQGDLGVTATDRIGAASPSSDGRYVAYEREEGIWVVDRTTRQTWAATTSVSRRIAPAFSPDGRHLAMLGGNDTAGVFLYVIAFTPNATAAVTDANLVKSTSGNLVSGSGRIAWVNA